MTVSVVLEKRHHSDRVERLASSVGISFQTGYETP